MIVVLFSSFHATLGQPTLLLLLLLLFEDITCLSPILLLLILFLPERDNVSHEINA